MKQTLTIATAQSQISSDIEENSRLICLLMEQAKEKGAVLVHFPEGALSGYVKSEIKSWEDVDWNALEDALQRVQLKASDLGIWVVLGCNHMEAASRRPFNSLYVISDEGKIVARYDKRYCAHTEIKDWYRAGTQGEAGQCIFEVDGFSFGCALCIEINFMDIFDAYEKKDVDCMLFSAYSPDPVFWTQASGYAATTNMWFSVANAANCSKNLPSGFIAPSGRSVIRGIKTDDTDLLISTLDRTDPSLDIALNKARPWRRLAREGKIYAN